MPVRTLVAAWRRLCADAPTPFAARHTPASVRALLDPHAAAPPERRDAALRVASTPGLWTQRVGTSDRCLPARLRSRLPTVVLLHVSGRSPDEIAHRLG